VFGLGDASVELGDNPDPLSLLALVLFFEREFVTSVAFLSGFVLALYPTDPSVRPCPLEFGIIHRNHRFRER
jgi:hypothetical protein